MMPGLTFSQTLRNQSTARKQLRQLKRCGILLGVHGRAGKIELVDGETGGHRALDVGGVQDGERDDDGARPGRHLINEIEGQENDFGRNGGAGVAREKAKEAEVDANVAIGGLQPAQFHDAIAQAAHALVFGRKAGYFQSEIRFDGGVDFRWALEVDIEAAIFQLARENGGDGAIDLRTGGRVPHAIHWRMQP